eukprot:118873_1
MTQRKRQLVTILCASIWTFILFSIFYYNGYIYSPAEFNNTPVTNTLILNSFHHECTETQLIAFEKCFKSPTMQEKVASGRNFATNNLNNGSIIECEFCGYYIVSFFDYIGRGSNGIVYSTNIKLKNTSQNYSNNRNTNTRYAIKISWNDEYCGRLQNEYNLLSTFSHPYLPKLHPAFTFYQWKLPNLHIHCLLVMEQIPNTINLNIILNSTSNWQQYLQFPLKNDSRLILETILNCYDNIKSALQHTHSHYIYHSDLQLLNMLFDTATYECYLLDFGRHFDMSDMKEINDENKKFVLDRNSIHTPYDEMYLSAEKRKRIIESHSNVVFKFSGQYKAITELRKYAALSTLYKNAVEFQRIIMFFYSTIKLKDIGCNLYHYKVVTMNKEVMYKAPRWIHKRGRLSRMLCRVKRQIKYFKKSMSYLLGHNQTDLTEGVIERLYKDVFDVIMTGVDLYDKDGMFCHQTDRRDYHLKNIINDDILLKNVTWDKNKCKLDQEVVKL